MPFGEVRAHKYGLEREAGLGKQAQPGRLASPRGDQGAGMEGREPAH